MRGWKAKHERKKGRVASYLLFSCLSPKYGRVKGEGKEEGYWRVRDREAHKKINIFLTPHLQQGDE